MKSTVKNMRKEKMKKIESKHMAVVNLDALLKLAEENDKENEEEFNKLQKELETAVKQYDKVVQQNKDLQTECNVYRRTLEEVRIMATKDLTINTFVNIQNKINEVL
jgi:hypothetical protein